MNHLKRFLVIIKVVFFTYLRNIYDIKKLVLKNTKKNVGYNIPKLYSFHIDNV